MKKVVLTILITLVVAVGVIAAQKTVAIQNVTQKTGDASLRVGESKRLATGLTIRFIEITDDSRCPRGTTCIWAGNAAVKVSVSIGRKPAKEFTLNSNLTPRSVDYEGYTIAFVSLTPKITHTDAPASARPLLAVSVTKIKH